MGHQDKKSSQLKNYKSKMSLILLVTKKFEALYPIHSPINVRVINNRERSFLRILPLQSLDSTVLSKQLAILRARTFSDENELNEFQNLT